MTDLNDILNSHVAPAPAPDLAERIAAAAQAQAPANDTARLGPKPLWLALSGMAALMVAGVLLLVPAPNGTDLSEPWQNVAEDAGFAELYAWTLDES